MPTPGDQQPCHKTNHQWQEIGVLTNDNKSQGSDVKFFLPDQNLSGSAYVCACVCVYLCVCAPICVCAHGPTHGRLCKHMANIAFSNPGNKLPERMTAKPFPVMLWCCLLLHDPTDIQRAIITTRLATINKHWLAKPPGETLTERCT